MAPALPTLHLSSYIVRVYHERLQCPYTRSICRHVHCLFNKLRARAIWEKAELARIEALYTTVSLAFTMINSCA